MKLSKDKIKNILLLLLFALIIFVSGASRLPKKSEVSKKTEAVEVLENLGSGTLCPAQWQSCGEKKAYQLLEMILSAQ